jgi:lysylphosphatidylglycerol synthetase-like protein (DUF2156 family)
MEGEGKVPHVRKPMEGEGKRFPFTPFHFPPNKFYSNLSFFYFLLFSLILTFYSTMVLAVTYAFPRFPLHISYDRAFDVTSSPHFIVDLIWLKILLFSLKLWRRIWPRPTSLKLHKRMKSQPWSRL